MATLKNKTSSLKIQGTQVAGRKEDAQIFLDNWRINNVGTKSTGTLPPVDAVPPHLRGYIFKKAEARNDLKIANLADGEPDSSMMNYVTEKGFFLDGRGRSYMQGGGKFQDAGEYDIDIHGMPVPMANRKSLSIAQFPRLSTGEPMTNIEQKQGLEVLKKLKGKQKRKQLKIFMDQYMKGV